MVIKSTRLRQNLYQLLDQVLEKGIPLEIERKGKILKIIPADPTDKFSLLEKHQTLRGVAEDLLGIDWSEAWTEGKITKSRSTNRNKKDSSK